MDKVATSWLTTIFAFVLRGLFLSFVGTLSAQEPSTNPPTGNTNPPLNTSGTGQTKTGALVISGGASLGALIVNGGSTLNGNLTVTGQVVGASSGFLIKTPVQSTGLYVESDGKISLSAGGGRPLITDGIHVGVGTTNPLSKFHVKTGTNQNILFANNSNGSYSGAPGIISLNDANSAYQPLGFVASNYYFAGGSVGLGTSAPSGSLKLDVEGAIGATQYCDNNGANCIAASSLASGGGLWTGSGGNIYYSGGNVGIGTNSPSGELTIDYASTGGVGVQGVGQGLVLNAVTPSIVLNDTSSGVDNYAIHLNQNDFRIGRYTSASSMSSDFLLSGGSTFLGGMLRVGGGIQDASGNTIRDAGGGWVRTYGNAGWYSQSYQGGWYMTDTTFVRSYNNKPVYTASYFRGDDGFDVDGNRVISEVGGRNITARWNNNSNYGYFEARRDDGTRGGYFGYGNGSSYISIITDAASALYINGNVGIGLTSPGQKLDVNGNARASAFLYSSDERLKENIESLAVSRSNNLLQLNAYTFDWKDGHKNNDIGLIAQEVQKYFPEFVAKDENGNLSVDYPKIVVPMLEVIKNQEQRISDLEEKMQSLVN